MVLEKTSQGDGFHLYRMSHFLEKGVLELSYLKLFEFYLAEKVRMF